MLINSLAWFQDGPITYMGAGHQQERLGSGTKGGIVTIDELLDMTIKKFGNTELLLPALRLLLNKACFLPSEGGSVSPNFASKEAVLVAFSDALNETGRLDDPLRITCEPMKLVDVRRQVVRSMIAGLYPEPVEGKVTESELRKVLETIPGLKDKFTTKSMKFLGREGASANNVIPKNLLSSKDLQIIQALRYANPDKVIDILLAEAERSQDVFDKLVGSSELIGIMQTMGYETDETIRILKRLRKVKGVYKVQ